MILHCNCFPHLYELPDGSVRSTSHGESIFKRINDEFYRMYVDGKSPKSIVCDPIKVKEIHAGFPDRIRFVPDPDSEAGFVTQFATDFGVPLTVVMSHSKDEFYLSETCP